MAERIRLSLAGQLGVEVDGTVVDTAALGPLGSLALAFLATERSRPVTREELADVLWGEELPATWEPSLRSVISRVRRRLEGAGLPGDVIAGGHGFYQLRLPVDTVVDVEAAAADVSRAGKALAGGDHAAAMRHARSAADVCARPFLPGVANLWAERRQRHLDELRLQALEVFAEAATAVGDHAGAIAAADEVLDAQPLRESAHVRAMAAHAAAGDRGEALRAYERCRRLLAEELGVSPSEATEAAYLALLSGKAASGPARPARPATNLGTELSSFVGRTQQLRAVGKALETSRLLTLVGPGGVGKTRLARHAGSDALDRYRDGVWLVELAPLSDPVLLGSHVLVALGLADEPGKSASESLCRHLMDREILLVLDNCEHLLAACAPLIKTMLQGARGLSILATSREPLGVTGESIWPVPPLSLPAIDEDASDRLWESEAVRLFVDRASAADPSFSLADEDGPALADLCRRLDGLPLAIELAAARARSLSVADIAARVRDRFALLVGRDPTAPDRHHTLRAAVDWSYESLSEAEAALFRRLSVFAGGWTLEAAEAVCGADGGEHGDLDVVDGLGSLVDKSLVVADRSSGATRYRLLETLRQYGAERLSAEGEAAYVRDRHLEWSCSLAERAEPELEGHEQGASLRVLDAEENNLRAALEWAVTRPGRDEGLRAAAAVWRYWQVRGRFDEGERWLQTLLDRDRSGEAASAVRATQAPAVRAKALMSAAILVLAQPEVLWTDHMTGIVRSRFEESLAIREALGDRRGAAAALHGLGGMYHRQGDYKAARACFEKTLAIGRELGEKRLIAASLTNLAGVAGRISEEPGMRSDDLDARSLYEESVRLWRDLGDHFATARALIDLSSFARRERQFPVARALLGEALALQRQIDDRRGVATTLQVLADVASCEADLTSARSLLEEALSIRRNLHDPFSVSRTLVQLGDVASVGGDLAEARRLYQDAAAIARSLEHRGALYEATLGLASLALVTGDLRGARRLTGEMDQIWRDAPQLQTDHIWAMSVLAVLALAEADTAEAARAAQRALQTFAARPHQPSETLATVLDVFAVLAAENGDYERAATLIGAADASRRPPPFTPYRPLAAFQRALAAAQAGLGSTAFERAHARGATMRLGEVLEFAGADVP